MIWSVSAQGVIKTYLKVGRHLPIWVRVSDSKVQEIIWWKGQARQRRWMGVV